MQKIVSNFYSELKKYGNPVDADAMAKYMKNLFQFVGIKKPLRENIERKFSKEFGNLNFQQVESAVNLLWNYPERECQYTAMVIIEKNKKVLSSDSMPLLEKLILSKSWWDTVDFIAANPIGLVLNQNPNLINESIDKWMNSGNMWLQRTCLLFQLKYKKNTNFELLCRLSEQLSGSKEFFIQKAIGWALREYSKTNPTAVQNFIENTTLAPLSLREGLKVIQRS